MVRLRKKGNTSVVENHTRVLVTFYKTLIFSWYKTMGSIVLNRGACRYWTATTKLRINQCFQEYNLPYHLFQKDGDWYLRTTDTTDEWYNKSKNGDCFPLIKWEGEAITIPH